MKLKKKIEISLNYRIKTNNEKIQNLINKSINSKDKTKEDNNENKENIPHLINRQKQPKQFKHKYTTLTYASKTKDNDINSITKTNYSIYANERLNQKKTIKNQKKYKTNRPNLYYPIKNSKNNDILEVNNFFKTQKNGHNLLKKNKYKTYNNFKKNEQKNNNKSNGQINKFKKYNNNKRLKSKDIKSINNKNENNYSKDDSTDSNKLESVYSSMKNSIDLNQMLIRFEEEQRKKDKKLQKLQKQKEAKEKELYTYRPKLFKNNSYFTNKTKDDFLTRQKKFSILKSENEKRLKEDILKNEQEKINKNSFILQKRNKENSNASNCLNNSFLSEISYNRSMAEIDLSVTRLFEWENRRKEKINKKINEINMQIESNKHIPTINKRSISMVIRNRNKNKNLKIQNIYDRLSKEDEIVKAKKRIIAELLTPTFKPNLYLTVRNNDEDEMEENFLSYKFSKRNSVDKDKSFRRIIVNRNNNIKPKNNNKNDNILFEENEKIENDDIFDIYRKTIINNINKKIMNKSVDK